MNELRHLNFTTARKVVPYLFKLLNMPPLWRWLSPTQRDAWRKFRTPNFPFLASSQHALKQLSLGIISFIRNPLFETRQKLKPTSLPAVLNASRHVVGAGVTSLRTLQTFAPSYNRADCWHSTKARTTRMLADAEGRQRRGCYSELSCCSREGRGPSRGY